MQIYKADDIFADGEGIVVKKETVNRVKNPHKHEFIELVYVTRGSGTEVVGDKEYVVGRGDLLFVNFGATHAFQASDMDFVHILLRPEFVSEALVNSENIFDVFSLPQFSTITGDFGKNCIVNFEGEERETMSEIIDAMLKEYGIKSPGYKTVLHGYTQVLFTHLIRRLKEKDTEKNLSVKKIESYVDEHLDERLTLSDIADSCFYNPSYFSRKFKQLFGKNLSDYVKERRLDRAAELLRKSELSVDSICKTTGFSDKSKFYKVFKERFSLTPSEYKKGKK